MSRHLLDLSAHLGGTVWDRANRALFSFTVFWAAYLLFQIEPLIGKFILPWFGGSPAVWTTCMLFFQLLVFAGYAYAHFSLKYFQIRQQTLLHIGLILVAIMMLPVTPETSAKPEDAAQPTLTILALLIQSVGLPFFVLSSTSPLLQAWYVRVYPNHSPYRLYALSNIGSFFALLSYPFLFEPFFRLSQQTRDWSLGFGLFILTCGSLSVLVHRAAILKTISATPAFQDRDALLADQLSPGWRWFFWLTLPSITSILLLAITNQLCQDIASVPFLWIVPLGFYLISFILCFAERRWYQRRFVVPLAVITTSSILLNLYVGNHFSLIGQIALYNLGLFFCCMICHGELFRLRPQPIGLTTYYLAIAAGGVFGSLFVALICPLIFSQYFELHIGLWACFALLLSLLRIESTLQTQQRRDRGKMSVGLALLGLMTMVLSYHAYQLNALQLSVSRNFYGVLRVVERDVEQPEFARRVLRHGAIDHGFQFLAPDKQHLATAYYRPQTGVGLVMQHFPHHPKRIGIVGLGVGTLLSYGETGDYFRIYDINPQVISLAEHSFSFLRDSAAEYDIITADARLALERDPPQGFDILVLDAFSGDAIPMHLLTREAVVLYFQHLREDGVLAVHISNRYLNLEPLLQGLATDQNYAIGIVRGKAMADDFGLYRSDWAYITRNQTFLNHPEIRPMLDHGSKTSQTVLWTDDFSNLFSLLK